MQHLGKNCNGSTLHWCALSDTSTERIEITQRLQQTLTLLECAELELCCWEYLRAADSVDGWAISECTSAACTVLPSSFLTAGWIGVGFDASADWFWHQSHQLATHCMLTLEWQQQYARHQRSITTVHHRHRLLKVIARGWTKLYKVNREKQTQKQ